MERTLTAYQEEILYNLINKSGLSYSSDNPQIQFLRTNQLISDEILGYSVLAKGMSYYNDYLQPENSESALEEAIAASVQRVKAGNLEHQSEILRRQDEQIASCRVKFLKVTGLTEETISLLKADFRLSEDKDSEPVAMTFNLDDINFTVEVTKTNRVVSVNATSDKGNYPRKIFYFGLSGSFDDGLLSTVDEIRHLEPIQVKPPRTRGIEDENVRKTALDCLLAMIQGGNIPDCEEAIRIAKQMHSLMD